MSWWNAKYKNNHSEYEITFASKDYEKAKAVEKVCCAVMDKAVKSPFDVEIVVRCRGCKHYATADFYGNTLCGCTLLSAMVDITPDSFCSYGERKGCAD